MVFAGNSRRAIRVSSTETVLADKRNSADSVWLDDDVTRPRMVLSKLWQTAKPASRRRIARRSFRTVPDQYQNLLLNHRLRVRP